MMSMLVLMLAACTNSGLGLPSSTASSADTGTSTATTGGSCPWTGDWTLTAVSCGSFPFDGWFVDHDSAALTAAPHASGGCELTIEVTGPACARTEVWRVTDPVGTEADATYEGITACDPDACAFTVEEPTCAVGGGATKSQSITADDASGDLTLEAILGDTAPGCSLAVFTTWSPAR
jgi:hypothetical protein